MRNKAVGRKLQRRFIKRDCIYATALPVRQRRPFVGKAAQYPQLSLSADLLPGSALTAAQAVKKQVIVTNVPASAEVPTAASHPGWVGVSTKYLGNSVALITEVAPGGPAARAGLRAGDIITAVNGIPTTDEDPNVKIAAYKPGSKVRIGYMRDSWAFEAKVTVGVETR